MRSNYVRGDDLKQLDSSYEVLRRVKRLKALMHENMSQMFEEVNLTGPQGMLVGILHRHGSLKISDLSEQMGLSMSTVSSILNRLERDRVVVRERSDSDGRVILIKLTDEFLEKSTKVFKRIETAWEERLNRATSDEIETILNALKIFERLLGEPL